MASAGIGGVLVEFISRSWIATSMRNFAAVAIRLSFTQSIARAIPPSSSGLPFPELIKRERAFVDCRGQWSYFCVLQAFGLLQRSTTLALRLPKTRSNRDRAN